MLALSSLLLLAVVGSGRAADFARGADVGWLAQMEAAGYQFRDAAGKPEDCLKILRNYGLNTIRLRVFVNPSNDPRRGHCSAEEVAAMAVRAHEMGFRILLDFHYSDIWADPKHQKKPAAWAQHTAAELEQDVYEHTHAVLQTLAKRGVTPEWVQIGNEISNGLLWPEGSTSNPAQLARFINAGTRAVRAINPQIKVIVHLDQGNDSAHFRWFFDRLEKYHGQYDVIGLSYYPYWLKSDYPRTIDDLGRNLSDLATRYHKAVMVVEVGGEATQPDHTHDLLAAVLAKVRAVPGGQGLGVVYWEPEAAVSWSHYPLSCWGADGRPTRALDAFREDQARSKLPKPATPLPTPNLPALSN